MSFTFFGFLYLFLSCYAIYDDFFCTVGRIFQISFEIFIVAAMLTSYLFPSFCLTSRFGILAPAFNILFLSNNDFPRDMAYYLTQSWWQREIYTFPKDISTKMNEANQTGIRNLLPDLSSLTVILYTIRTSPRYLFGETKLHFC